MKTNNAKHRILALMLAVGLAVGATTAATPVTVHAILPPTDDTARGMPWDGIDFDALVGDGFYFGVYNHATELDETISGAVTKREETETPILWRVMGEDNGSNRLTLWSEYVLDSRVINDSTAKGSQWASSDLQSWLHSSAFTDSFSGAELPQIADNLTVQTNVTGVPNTASTATDQSFYLPWAASFGSYNIFMDIDNVQVPQLTCNSVAETGYLKGTAQAVRYWLRSPGPLTSSFGLGVGDDGEIRGATVTGLLGIRPVFQLNPASVIAVTKVVSGADGAAENWKQSPAFMMTIPLQTPPAKTTN